MKNKFSIALSLAVIVAMLVTSLAMADNVQNDVVAGGNDTITAGGSTTVNYRITANNGDNQTGCNAADTSPATVTINTPAGVTATPSSLTFTSCGTDQSVVFSSSAVGEHEITVSVSDSGTGTYNTNPGKFTLVVNAAPPPSDQTAPVITPSIVGTLGENGWYVSDVTVSWTVEDGESAISSSTGCDPTTISTDTAGVTLTCSATSAGGTSSQSVTIKRDTTAPTISGSASPAPNGYGWNKADVDVSFSCSDVMSGIASCGPNTTLASEGANQSAAGTAVDNAGNSASTSVSPINIDKTAPTLNGAATLSPNPGGWYNGDVTVQWSCSDTLSGIDGSCPPNSTVTGEGNNLSASASVNDKAGNSTTTIVSGINIDRTGPVVTVTGVTDGATYTLGAVPAAGCSTTDVLSGVATAASLSLSGGPVGSITATCSGALDNAGNGGSASVTYTVHYSWNGFFQPIDNGASVWNTVKAGSAVPVKFSLGGNQGLGIFTTGYPKLVKVSCTSGFEDAIESTVTAGGSSLTYDALADQYIYVWKTEKSWAGLCGRLDVKLIDGTTHSANFKFK